MVYGENSATDYFAGPGAHGGANVWIRNKTDEIRYCPIDNHYIGVNKQLNYSNSRSYCIDNFATDLATIESSADNSLVRDSVTELNVATYETIWIGLNDIDSENAWYTWNDGTPVIYDKWNDGEPNDADDGEDCACLPTQNFWNDVPCDREYYFSCNSPTSYVNLYCKCCMYISQLIIQYIEYNNNI